MDKKTPESILLEAEEVCSAKRPESHGSFRDNFERAAAIYQAWTGNPTTARNVTQMLQALKMAREESKPDERDHYVDAAGYTSLRYRLRPPIETKGNPESSYSTNNIYNFGCTKEKLPF